MNRFTHRPLSFSQWYSFRYYPEDWYDNYILGKRKPQNTAMRAGSVIGDSIGTHRSLVPALNPPGYKEFPFQANLGDVRLIGYADHYCPITKTLHENKTTTSKTKWNQQSVDKHKQLDFYALMLALRYDIQPETIRMYLNYIPVIEGQDARYYLPDPVEVYTFSTKRTSTQVAQFAEELLQSVDAMERYIEERQALSPEAPCTSEEK